MITIYHLHHSRSDRIIWLMEELGLQYRLEAYQRDSSGTVPTTLREVHPLGKFPTIRDGETLICESGAIVEYLIHRHGAGRLAPSVNSPEYPRYLEWLHAAEGSAMLQLTNQLWVTRALSAGSEAPVITAVKDRSHHFLQYVDDELVNRPYFAGEMFTAADIMMTSVLSQTMDFMGIDRTRYPHFASYLERISARPAYQNALRIANPKT